MSDAAPTSRARQTDLTLQDRRREPRFAANEKVKVTLLESPFNQFSGKLMNVSRNGVAVQLPALVYPGSRIMISWSKTSVFGEIRHCREVTESAFYVGVAIDRRLTQGSDFFNPPGAS